MRKKLLCCILVSTLTLQFGGCGEPKQEKAENSDTVEAESTNPEGEDLFLPLTDIPWQDNSLDAYSAVLNIPLRYTETEGSLEGGVCLYILGNTRASVFKKHLMQEATDRWDEFKTVTDQSVEVSFRLDFWEGELNQAWAVGSIAGNDHYMMLKVERDNDQG